MAHEACEVGVMKRARWEVLLDRFIDYQAVVLGRSASTLANHRRRVSMWLMFLATRRKSAAAATREDAMLFWRNHREVYAPGTLNHMLSSLRQFYRWLKEVEGVETECPFEDFRNMSPIPVARKTWLTSDDIKKILRMPLPATPRHLRDRALFAILVSTAARIKEVLALDVGQLRPDIGRVMLQYTKTGVPREALLLEEVWPIIEAYIVSGRPRLLKSPSQTALFIGTRNGNRLSYKQAWHAMHRLADMAGVPHFSPHDIRRSVATIMRDANIPIDVIAAMLGHTKLSTTEMYLRWNASARLATAREMHPLRGEVITPDALNL